jgi:putative redox protein
MPKAVARRRGGYTHDVEVDSHSLVVDERIDSGGADHGPSPTRVLAAALASCTAITTEMYANRKGWELGDVNVEVEMEYDGPVPSSFTVTLNIPAELSPEQRERVRAIASKCPVHRALSRETDVAITDVVLSG